MHIEQNPKTIYLTLEEKLRSLNVESDDPNELSRQITRLTEECLAPLDENTRTRINNELNKFGPIEDLLNNSAVTEIIINGSEHIFAEKNGRLEKIEDSFFSEHTYKNFIDRLCELAGCHETLEHPFADGHFNNARFSLVRNEITHDGAHVSIRKHPLNSWSLDKLVTAQWCSALEAQALKQLIHDRKSFLIVGPTSAGKTSIINALIQEMPDSERLVVIEDTSEICLPNPCSMKMLTRNDPYGSLPPYDQCFLLKQALRLRPDRLVIGEIRGNEAKDFLMLLSTGHSGSFGTLHAADPRQALLRLEMLIQSASNWNLQAIRKLIFLSLEYIVVTGRDPSGKRKFQGLYRLSSLEENGFLIESVDCY